MAKPKIKVTELRVRCLHCGDVLEVSGSSGKASCGCINNLSLTASATVYTYTSNDFAELEKIAN